MNPYCCQIFSISGRVLEIFFPSFEEAKERADDAVEFDKAEKAFVFLYPDMDTPIYNVGSFI